MKYFKVIFKGALGLFILINITSCIPDFESKFGKWEFYQADNISSNETANSHTLEFGSSIYINQDGYFLMSIMGINDIFSLTENSKNEVIFLDRYHTDFQSQVLFGKWSNEDKKTLKLEVKNYDFKEAILFDIKKIKNKEFNFSVNTNKDKKFIYHYKKTEEDPKKSEYNFVKPEHNQWRVPAKKSETEEQIKIRIIRAIDFAIMYMKYHEQEELYAGIDFLRPLPFYFAANGFRLRQDSAWEKLFYNLKEADKSYQIFAEAFSNLENKQKREFDGNSVKLITLLFEDLRRALD